MFLYKEPSTQRIARFLDAQRDAPFNYDEVGASREAAKELAAHRLSVGEVGSLRVWLVDGRHLDAIGELLADT